MLDALEQYMPKHPDLYWTRPEGGLFLWISVPFHINTDDMFLEAIQENVTYVVGSGFYAEEDGKHAMRLNFSYPSLGEIVEGVKRLAKVIQRRL